MSYPDPTLNTTYTYDTGTFGKGRLTGITRHGETLAYTYDRFGRLTQDGTLAYTWDQNGNRTTITYPEAITAAYAHDFADRETTLSVQVGADPPLQLVNGAAYEPFGPLKTLDLGNGLTETRSSDDRYAPAEIRVDGTSPVLDWSYTTDLVGNISGITDLLNAANNRTYGYQDIHYFLTQGNGPWGPRSWTYDRIGNRLTETRGAATDTYTYPLNTSGGRSPKLQSVAPPTGESRKYGYDAAGNNTFIYDRDNRLDLIYDSASRLYVLRSVAEDARTHLLYDGRGFLRQASAGVAECRPGVTIPTYDSEGLLHRRSHLALFTPAAPPTETDTVFYFTGRPVAATLQLAPSSSTLTYLTTDHLGTPILATADTGALVWQGGFEPFGENWNGASGAGVFLRFPGQWVDQVWESARLESELYYNVWRWYGHATGRYGQPDPLGRDGSFHSYGYVRSNPIAYLDTLGLMESSGSCSCCSDQETTRQLTQITNYIRANAPRYRISSSLFSGGCGGAADRMQRDVERDLKPSCWITKSQLLRKATGLNVVGYKLLGITPSVHRVLKIAPCSPNRVFHEDIGLNPYYGIGPVGPVVIGPLSPQNQIDDILDPPYWCSP